MVDWSLEWKLRLNASKSESAFFSTWTKEANWSPVIEILGKPIKFNPTPRFLGVTLDRQLTFSPHTENVIESVNSKCKMLGALSHSEWGWPKDSLRRVYTSSIRPAIDYGSAAWQPWLSKTNMSAIESAQNKALRLISGQYRSSPVESLRKETGIPSYQTISNQSCIKAREKGLRCPPDHPHRVTFEIQVPQRTKRTSCRSKAEELTASLNIDVSNRKMISSAASAPWSLTKETAIFDDVPGIRSRADDVELKKEASLIQINEFSVKYTIYTDGSASEGRREGGAAAVVTTGDPANPSVMDTIKARGRALTCSYEEE